MTNVQAGAANSFVVGSEQGRTAEPLNILGEPVLVKLASGDADGAAAVFHITVPPMSGPPLHRHSREDEWFYVLEGVITFEIDGERTVAKAGDSAFAARGTVHAYQNFTAETAKLLVMTTPGTSFNEFFVRLSAHNMGLAAPDFQGSERLMNEYGMEMVGPPLS
jgi:quercetin dioxygenase-like cupin family protein